MSPPGARTNGTGTGAAGRSGEESNHVQLLQLTRCWSLFCQDAMILAVGTPKKEALIVVPTTGLIFVVGTPKRGLLLLYLPHG